MNEFKAISRLRSHSKTKLNDNKWHLVTIWRSTRSTYELTVDSLTTKHVINMTQTSEAASANQRWSLSLVDKLYVGGLRNESEYSQLRERGRIAARHGYLGCLASIEINGRVPDFDEILHVYNRMQGNITKGCECMNIYFQIS